MATSSPPLEALREECELVSETVFALSEVEFALPTRLPAWNVKELLGHMYRDIERTHTGLAEPEPAEADTDAMTYWRAYDPRTDSGGVADRAKEVAGRYASGGELAAAWDVMWREAVDKAAAAGPDRIIPTWGPRMRLNEFLKTRVLEITVHRLDLDDALGRQGWGTDTAVGIVDDILVGLLGEEPPPELDWDVIDFIEKGTGREPLADDEREALGDLAARFPLLA